ncbi:MAG: hypothetical protein F7C81_00160 [Desulfurococcales archaeon]|nr:hypothetical protein [Desulfurococcales archaeon]
MLSRVTRVLGKAWFFIVVDPFGPQGDYDSFTPTKVSYDEERNRWIVECEFKRRGELVRARVLISDSGEVLEYEELQRRGA